MIQNWNTEGIYMESLGSHPHPLSPSMPALKQYHSFFLVGIPSAPTLVCKQKIILLSLKKKEENRPYFLLPDSMLYMFFARPFFCSFLVGDQNSNAVSRPHFRKRDLERNQKYLFLQTLVGPYSGSPTVRIPCWVGTFGLTRVAACNVDILFGACTPPA